MIVIDVFKHPNGLYYGCDKGSTILFQHCTGYGLTFAPVEYYRKALYVAAAHNWKIKLNPYNANKHNLG